MQSSKTSIIRPASAQISTQRAPPLRPTSAVSHRPVSATTTRRPVKSAKAQAVKARQAVSDGGLKQEQQRLAAIVAARAAARAAACNFSITRLRQFQQTTNSGAPPRPKLITLRDAPALLKHWREQQQQQQGEETVTDDERTRHPRRPSSVLAASATRLPFPHSGFSPWGFYSCTLSDDVSSTGGETVLKVRAKPPHDQLPELILARPCGAEDKRLAFGPFAFRLSPSSEVLAWLALTMLRPMLSGKHCLELGSGLGLTGLAVASWCECASIRLTDGDPVSFRAVQRNVILNAERRAFGATSVDASQLMWGKGSADDDKQERQSYDIILAADCVYDRALHVPLCQTIRRWLSATGVCVVVASRRCGSLADFERCARGEFAVHAWPQPYDDTVAAKFKGHKCYPSVMTLRLAARERR